MEAQHPPTVHMFDRDPDAAVIFLRSFSHLFLLRRVLLSCKKKRR